MPEKFRILWEQLSSLWVCIALNPNANESERKKCSELLQSWTQLTFCPLEDANFRERVDTLKRKRNINMRLSDEDDDDEENEHENEEDANNDEGNENRAIFVLANQNRLVDDVFSDEDSFENLGNNRPWRRSRKRVRGRKFKSKPIIRTIFHRALEASHLRWDDVHLRAVLDGKHTHHHAACRQSVINADTEMTSLHSSESFPYSGSGFSSIPSYSCPLSTPSGLRSPDPPVPSSSESSPSSSSSSAATTTASASSSSSVLFNSQGCPLWNGKQILSVVVQTFFNRFLF